MEPNLGPVYGLEVPPGPHLIAGSKSVPVTFRVTMAAINPTERPQADEHGNLPPVSRSTLSIVRAALDEDEDDEDDEDDEHYRALLEESSDDESNGGPSDLSKSKKQKAQAALKKLLESTQGGEDDDSDSDEVMTDARPNGKAGRKTNGVQASKKGKEKAVEVEEDEDEDEDDESDDGSDLGLEQFVLCTLDTERTYQQPLNITIKPNEEVFFTVSGTHSVYLTGNYILDEEEYHSDDEDDEDYDEDELDGELDDSEEESDLLDDLENPRVTELESSDEEEEAPKLVEAKSKKGKKRPAEDDAEDLDQLISKDAKDTKAAEPKLSKKQQKKLKNNQGEAVAAAEDKKTPATPKNAGKADKKTVQFAKQLEQGPTGSAEKAKAVPSVKERDGVTIDDRTIGTGRTVKPGDKVSVRYIGRLTNGSVFDANKKGKPFQFTVGKGEVIKGWDTGLVGMAPGGERRLTIPPKLAYGSKKVGEIPGNSTLRFDIKLLEIK